MYRVARIKKKKSALDLNENINYRFYKIPVKDKDEVI